MSSHSESFDYLIVGGGTAGLVVATRLAENPLVKVGVLEAGVDLTSEVNIRTPGFYLRNFTKEPDWTFMSVPQTHADNRSIYLPRGKGLGGSSILNLMQLGRAPAWEYDALESLGAEGWNSKEFLKYFKKSQTLAYPLDTTKELQLKPDAAEYGEGPIINTLPKTTSDIHLHWIKACEEVGVPFNPNPASGNNMGAWPSANAIHPDTATRISSASAYYEPNKHKENLVVITGARATRIIFDTKRASGELVAEAVEYSKDGVIHVATAKKEVILSAGSFQTPQLLELSGIGDEEILKKHGIPTVLHLPSVGKNLQDHMSLFFVCETTVETFDVLLDAERNASEWKLYEEKKEGMMTTVPLSYSFLPLKTFAQDDTIRNAALSLKKSEISEPILNLLKGWVEDENVSQLESILVAYCVRGPNLPPPEPRKNYFSFSLNLAHPFARGSVHIKAADPLALPDVDLSAFDNDYDMAVLVDAIKFSRKLVSTKALGPFVVREVAPGPDIKTDEEIKKYIRKNVGTSFHPLGTAAMLPRAQGGVVNSTLKVYGVQNLRIVDASILPIQLAAHSQATVYAIAEKGADIIKSANK